jgi:hypothetical protein
MPKFKKYIHFDILSHKLIINLLLRELAECKGI